MEGGGKGLKIVRGTEVGVDLGRIDTPIALRNAINPKAVMKMNKTYVVGEAIRRRSLDVQRRRTDPNRIIPHLLDVIELGGKGVPSPATEGVVSGVARRSLLLRGKAVGDDSVRIPVISVEQGAKEKRRAGRPSGSAIRPLLRRW